VNAPVLSRKRKRPNYRTIEQHFQVEGYHESSDGHHPATPEDNYRSIYFEAIDILTSSIKSRFDQPSFRVFLKLERYLLQAINESSIDDDIVKFLRDTYNDDVDALEQKSLY